MDAQIVAIFCLCDDILKELHHPEDIQRKMSDAEVMTTSIVAATFFTSNMETTRIFLKEQGYIPNTLGKSRLNVSNIELRVYFLRCLIFWIPYGNA